MPPFSQDFDVISKKKIFSLPHADFDGPSAGPPEAYGLRGHCPPCSPHLVGPGHN